MTHNSDSFSALFLWMKIFPPICLSKSFASLGHVRNKQTMVQPKWQFKALISEEIKCRTPRTEVIYHLETQTLYLIFFPLLSAQKLQPSYKPNLSKIISPKNDSFLPKVSFPIYSKRIHCSVCNWARQIDTFACWRITLPPTFSAMGQCKYATFGRQTWKIWRRMAMANNWWGVTTDCHHGLDGNMSVCHIFIVLF